ncbi:MAG: ECF transporter S component [Christensenella sp.]|uniref:ECF transporter S component n=1 Tax=Christensenella sp. TaxID=1935934 RepID=UPI002B2042F5|nr:ECF transporter S component [Christensenella sp.]MEA5001930.1 ECF transporter S component [Christensenella sp.]
MKNETKKLVAAALCLAAGMLLPMVFHAFGGGAGQVFLPMHIPVLVCGLICGWKYGGICGFILPLLSSFATGMPPLYPIGVVMMFELCVYGIVSGLLYRKLNVYLALIGAMLAGRVVSGLLNTILLGMAGTPYSFEIFLTNSFVVALPGIIIQIIVIPILVMLLKKTGWQFDREPKLKTA